jgi:hypothetical protein
MQTATGLLAVSAAGGLTMAAIRPVGYCHMEGVAGVIHRNEKLE